MLTGILCTARNQPGFQMMADSLALNLNHTLIDFELIVVDKLLYDYGFFRNVEERYRELTSAVAGRFSFRHVPPKPSPWQGPGRRTRKDWFDLNNARNTGLALARGSHVVFLDDCCALDPAWLSHHNRAAQRGVALAGSFQYYKTFNGFKAGIPVGEAVPDCDHRVSTGASITSGGWLWGLNMSFPLAYALQVNGFDEMYSGQGGSDDCDMGVRLERVGCKILYWPECKVYPVLEHHVAIDGWRDATKKQKERVLRDGKSHYANEFLIQELLSDQYRTLPKGNDFVLKDVRAKALATGAFPTHRELEVDWRDGQNLSEM